MRDKRIKKEMEYNTAPRREGLHGSSVLCANCKQDLAAWKWVLLLLWFTLVVVVVIGCDSI